MWTSLESCSAYTSSHSQAFSSGFPSSLLPSVTLASPPVLSSFCNLCFGQTFSKFFLSSVPFYILFLLPRMPALLIKLLSILQGLPTSLFFPVTYLFSLPAHQWIQLYTSHLQPLNTSQQASTGSLLGSRHWIGWSPCFEVANSAVG